MDKKKLGTLIGILRKEKYKETKNNKWLQINFCDGICSKSTLSRLEAGLIVSCEEVYVRLSNRLRFGYASIDLIDETLIKLEHKLLDLVDQGEDEQIKSELLKMQKLLRLSSEFIYYHQLELIVDDLLGYYTDHQFTSSFDIEAYIQILDVYSEPLSSVLRMYLYLYIHNTQEDVVYFHLTPKLKLNSDQSIAVQICYFHSLFVQREPKVLDLFIPIWKSANTRRKKELQSLLKLYEAHFKLRLPEHLFEYIELELPTLSIMTQLNEGVYELHQNNIESFARIYEDLISSQQAMPTYSLLSYMYNTKDKERVLDYIKSTNYIARELHEKFFRYLTLKDDLERQSYIMDVIYYSLKDVNRLYLDFFTTELFELSKRTKRYKDLHKMLALYHL